MTTARILGLGRQSNLADVVRLAESELETIDGPSRRLIAVAPNIEVEAARSGLSGPFESFLIRVTAEGVLRDAIRAIPEKASTRCTVADVDGRCELSLEFEPGIGPSADDPNNPFALLSDLILLPEVWHVHGEGYRNDRLSAERLFRAMEERRASDLHLYPGSPPVFRTDGVPQWAADLEPVSADQILALLRELAPARDWEKFLANNHCSFNYHQLGLAFSRVSAFVKSGVPHLTIRFLPEAIPTFEELQIPREVMERLGGLRHGLVMVTGMTGSGKTTTVASLIDWINANKALHIVTIEDPVEFVHLNNRSIVSQRNVGTDVERFLDGVHAALRHDPDVIYIGEMRDAETIRAAIDAASTGHLVLTTFHSNTAAETINRTVSFFTPVERDLVRLQLRESLQCIICQRLMPKVGGGRIPALEFLFNDTQQIAVAIQKGDSVGMRLGMQQPASDSSIFEKGLHNLVKQGLISMETAQTYATSPEILEQMRLGTYVPPHLERINLGDRPV